MALTGFLVNRGGADWTCADGSANAILALGARFPYTAGSQPVLCSIQSSVFSAPNTFTNTVTCHSLTGAQDYTFSHPLQLMQCDPGLTDTATVFFMDGLQMGWGVVAAMAAALAVIFIKKSFFR